MLEALQRSINRKSSNSDIKSGSHMNTVGDFTVATLKKSNAKNNTKVLFCRNCSMITLNRLNRKRVMIPIRERGLRKN